MDASDLLSFLRGELPVPKPSTPASSSPQSDLQKLFKGFPPLATSTPPASSSTVPPTIQSPVNPLLSLLNFGNSPPITSPSPALPVKTNGVSGTAELLARLGLGSSTSPQIDRNVEVKESTPLAAETEADEPIEEISEVHGIKMEEDLITSARNSPFAFVSDFDAFDRVIAEEQEALVEVESKIKENGGVKLSKSFSTSTVGVIGDSRPHTPSTGSHATSFGSPNNRKSILVEHSENSLKPSPVDTLPVTLFKTPVEPDGGQKLLIWEKGIIWAAKGGKIRCIDRLSGARLLFKGHEDNALDITVATATLEGKKLVGSVGKDSKLIIWKFEDGFDEEGAKYQKVIEVQGEKSDGARFRGIKFHPTKLEFTVIMNDEASLIVDLTKLTEGRFAGSEEEFFAHACVKVLVQPINKTRSFVVDFDYSPDGSAIAFLVSNGEYYIISSSASPSTRPLLHTRIHAPRQFETIQFIADNGDYPAALLIGSDEGSVFEVVEFDESGQKIEFLGNGVAKVDYHSFSKTIYASSSTLPLFTTFQLVFESIPRSDLDDASHISNSDFSKFNLKVIRSGDINTTGPITQFMFDPTAAEDMIGILCLHSGGIHQLSFPAALAAISPPNSVHLDMSFPTSVSMVEPENEFRRMSLEGQVLFTETTAIRSEKGMMSPGIANQEFISVTGTLAQPEPEIEIKKEVIGIEIKKEAVEVSFVTPPPAPEVERKLAGPVMNEAIKSLKASATKKTIKSEEETSVQSAWATGGSIAKKGKRKEEIPAVVPIAATGDLLREMKKLEESLPIKIGEIVRAEMATLAKENSSNRSEEKVAESIRQADLLEIISTTLNENTSVLIRDFLAQAVQKEIIPALNQAIEESVEKSVDINLEPILIKLLKSSSISQSLVKTLSSHLLPVLATHLLSPLTESINNSFKTVLKTIKAESKDSELAVEVKELRGEVAGLKDALARIENVMGGLKSRKDARTAREKSVALEEISVVEPIVESEEPESISFDTQFTNALLPSDSFDLLLSMISVFSQTSSLEIVLPFEEPKLSAPVILSLIFRLGGVLATAEKFTQQDLDIINWIERCLKVLEPIHHDSEISSFLPKVLSSMTISAFGRYKFCKDNNQTTGAGHLRRLLSIEFASVSLTEFLKN